MKSKRERKTRHSERKSRTDAVVIGGLVVLLIVVIWFLARDRSEPSAPATTGPPVTAPLEASRPLPAPPPTTEALQTVPKITPEELQTRMESGDIVVLDVRDANSYLAGHIPGSFHIPLEFIQSQLPYLPRDRLIVTYCT